MAGTEKKRMTTKNYIRKKRYIPPTIELYEIEDMLDAICGYVSIVGDDEGMGPDPDDPYTPQNPEPQEPFDPFDPFDPFA